MTGRIQNRASSEEFIKNFKEHARRLTDSGQAELVETEDATDLVVLGADAYRELLAILDRVGTIAEIEAGLAEFERGEGEEASVVFERIRAKYALPK